MDAELVNRIVREVVAALGGGAPDAAPNAQATPPSPSKPPTGGAPAETGSAPASSLGLSSGSPRMTVRNAGNSTRVFVTAEMLQQRLAGGADKGVIELAPNEALTPNAVDFAEQKRLTVRKASPFPAQAKPQAQEPVGGEGLSAQSGVAPAGAAVGIVVDRGNEKVHSALSALARAGVEMVDFAQTDCVLRNLAGLCQAIQQGRVGSGVAIAPYAAGLMALAGKFKGIRPVQATREPSVLAGVRQFHANLLVVEHAFATFHEIRRMVQAFADRPGQPPTDPGLMEAVARQEGA